MGFCKAGARLETSGRAYAAIWGVSSDWLLPSRAARNSDSKAVQLSS
jgi:hypothetical protein